MKKSVIALWIAAALFLACSFTFLPDGIGEFICGVAIAAVLAFLGYRQHKKPKEAPAEDIFPYDVKINETIISVKEHSDEEEAAPAPECREEEAAVKYVFAALEECGVDTSELFFDRTADYLKIVSDELYRLCFCRLKLSGQARYIELTVSAKDAKAFATDPRFSGVELAKRRFTRIPIVSAEDIKQYADVIRLAYVWGTTTA